MSTAQKNTNKNTATPKIAESENGFVTIGYCSPQAITFKVPGKVITLNGAKLSDIVNARGERYRQGKYGLTKMTVEDWELLQKVYGKSPLFKGDRIFMEKSKKGARKEAEERKDVTHGHEQITAESVRVTESKDKG